MERVRLGAGGNDTQPEDWQAAAFARALQERRRVGDGRLGSRAGPRSAFGTATISLGFLRWVPMIAALNVSMRRVPQLKASTSPEAPQEALPRDQKSQQASRRRYFKGNRS